MLDLKYHAPACFILIHRKPRIIPNLIIAIQMFSQIQSNVFNIFIQNTNLEYIGAFIHELEDIENVDILDYHLVKFERPFVVQIIYSYHSMETVKKETLFPHNQNSRHESKSRQKSLV